MHCSVMKEMSRAKTLKVLLSGESGTFTETVKNMPEVTECVVSQMKFVPSDSMENIWLDVDGERAPYKEMTITTTEDSLLVIAGPDYY